MRTVKMIAISVAFGIGSAVTAYPSTVDAATPNACGLLSTKDMQELFPGDTVTPPGARGVLDCSWAADAPDSNEYRILVSIRPNTFGRWEQKLPRKPADDPRYFHVISGFGEPAVYSIVDGIAFLKDGYVVQVAVIGTLGAAAAAPKEAEVARFVAAKFKA